MQSLFFVGSCCRSIVRLGTSQRSSPLPLHQGERLHLVRQEPSLGRQQMSCPSSPNQLRATKKQGIGLSCHKSPTKTTVMTLLKLQFLSLVRPIQMLCFLVLLRFLTNSTSARLWSDTSSAFASWQKCLESGHEKPC